tara:strand:- start:33 stop:935 length:903 start_codon:yes stop_codon:yes gene_type:complete
MDYLNKSTTPSYNEKIDDYNKSQKSALNFKFHLLKMIIHGEYHFFIINLDSVLYIDESLIGPIFDKFQTESIKALQTSGLAICGGDINKGYIIDQFHYNDICLLSFGETKKMDSLRKRKKGQMSMTNYDLLGFVFLDAYKHNRKISKNMTAEVNDSYISLICSNKRFGGILLEFMERLAKFEKYKRMQLGAVETAITYYLKMGYYPKINPKSKKSYEYKLNKYIPTPFKGSMVLDKTGKFLTKKASSKKSLKKGSNSAFTASRASNRLSKKAANTKKNTIYVLYGVEYDSDNNLIMIKNL